MLTLKHSAKNSSRAFTIVELLIVIVVIGILAAIVIVAYNNVTNKAQSSRLAASVNQWEKILRLYESEYGNLPSRPNDEWRANAFCLGASSDYPADSDFAEGICMHDPVMLQSDVQTATFSQDFIDSISTVSQGGALGKLTTVEVGGIKIRGVVYTVAPRGGSSNGEVIYNYTLHWTTPTPGACSSGEDGLELGELDDEERQELEEMLDEFRQALADPNTPEEMKNDYRMYLKLYEYALTERSKSLCIKILKEEDFTR